MEGGITKVSLVFDDGFIKSCLRIAEIFEARNLSATFAVLVNHEGFMPDFSKGDFDLWNQLQNRGHVIHPHGFDHADLSKIPFKEAKAKIDACLDYFTDHLSGFDVKKSVYHLTYNRSTHEVDAYLLSKVRAIRTTGIEGKVGSGMNGKTEIESRIFNCSWYGPEPCGEHFMDTIKIAEKKQPEMMLYMLHGLDDEGWGSIRSDSLERALDYIIRSPLLNFADLSA
ncbi:MAG: polysaccharide deacetylase family protein [Flavobacteriaceae bacterium]